MPSPYPNPFSSMKIDDNKYLLPDPQKKPVMVPRIEKVICLLDPWFENLGVRSFVTSGYRPANEQLDLIKRFAKEFGIDKEYPEILGADIYSSFWDEKFQGIYMWTRAWNTLLCRVKEGKGKLINPPLPAKLLWEYYHPDLKKIIPAGTLINLSTHQTGHAFDIGGRGGYDKTIKDEVIVMEAAIVSGEIPQIKSITRENVNNCVHVTLRDV